MLLTAITVSLVGCSESSGGSETSLSGSWVGIAIHREASLAITVRFNSSGEVTQGTISTPDAYQLDVPLRNVQYRHPNIHFEVEEVGDRLIFDGKRAGGLITGTLTRGDFRADFSLKHTSAETSANYSAEEVTFQHDTLKLNGTLLLPLLAGKHPLVIFVHGSGQRTRDDYRFYADHFARNGIAALIYDKRAVGGSGSNDERSDLNELAGDVLAAVKYLKGRSEINQKQIGLWGLSQGGWVVPLVAAQSSDIAFVIIVSAPGVKVGEVHLYAGEQRLRERGYKETEITEALTALREVDEFVRKGGNRELLQSRLDKARTKPWFESTILPGSPPTAEQQSTLFRWRNLDFDPAASWKRIKVPVLAFYGERDNVVPVPRSVEAIDKALKQAGNSDVTIKVYADANHLIKLPFGEQPDSGGKWDWSRPVPEYLDTMLNWTIKRVDLVR